MHFTVNLTHFSHILITSLTIVRIIGKEANGVYVTRKMPNSIMNRFFKKTN